MCSVAASLCERAVNLTGAAVSMRCSPNQNGGQRLSPRETRLSGACHQVVSQMRLCPAVLSECSVACASSSLCNVQFVELPFLKRMPRGFNWLATDRFSNLMVTEIFCPDCFSCTPSGDVQHRFAGGRRERDEKRQGGSGRRRAGEIQFLQGDEGRGRVVSDFLFAFECAPPLGEIPFEFQQTAAPARWQRSFRKLCAACK